MSTETERTPLPGRYVEQRNRPETGNASEPVEQDILRILRAIRYGSVEITIHDSRVVQIERREKLRFDGGAGEKRM